MLLVGVGTRALTHPELTRDKGPCHLVHRTLCPDDGLDPPPLEQRLSAGSHATRDDPVHAQLGQEGRQQARLMTGRRNLLPARQFDPGHIEDHVPRAPSEMLGDVAVL